MVLLMRITATPWAAAMLAQVPMVEIISRSPFADRLTARTAVAAGRAMQRVEAAWM
jgi:hypothetical protein